MTTQPLSIPEAEPEEHITERTRALINIQDQLNIATSQLQDVTKEVREIRRQLSRGESWRAAAWRALKNFVGFIEADREKPSR